MTDAPDDAPDTIRDWFERGYMAAYADSLADGKPIPLSDDLLDRAWERQAELVSAGQQPAAERLADAVCLAVAELPDRTSPEDWPEAMLVTADELRAIVRAALGGDA